MRLQWWRGGSSDGKPGYHISFDYDRELIERLKWLIPSQYREWNEESKTWWVSEHYEKAIDNLFPGFLEGVKSQGRLL